MRSIATLFFVYTALLTGLAVLIPGALTLHHMYRDNQERIRNIRAADDQRGRELLLQEVRRAVEAVQHLRRENTWRMKEDLRHRVENACDIALHLQNTYSDRMAADELAALIRETLRPVRFHNGRGYYFATSLEGIEILFADRPELEGKNLLKMTDSDGLPVIQRMIDIVTKKGEGFIEYRWTKPGSDSNRHPKIAFVKYSPSLNGFIGTGEYLEDIDLSVQSEALNRLNSIRFGKDDYIFAGTWDGLSLTGPAKGRNMLHIKDVNGLQVVGELIRTARNGGGFVEYFMPGEILSGPKTYQKLSYVLPVSPWEWYVGAGISLDLQNDRIKKQQQETTEKMVRDLRTLLLTLLALLLLNLLLCLRLVRSLNRSFRSFHLFFQKGADEWEEIDRSRMSFSEFDFLARQANRVIRAHQETLASLRNSENTYRTIFNATTDAISILDTETLRFLDVNQAFLNLCGFSRETVLTWRFDDMPPVQGDSVITADSLHERLAGQDTIHFERRLPDGDQRIIYTDNSIRRIRIAEQDRLLMVSRDVTDKKQLQEIMVQSEKMMSVGGLAAGMAHEINNPLGIMIQMTQNLNRRLSPDLKKNREAAARLELDMHLVQAYLENRSIPYYIDSIRNAGERAAQIIRSMLDFSRYSESRRALFRVEELLDRVIRLAENDYDLKKHYDFRNIEIIRQYGDTPPVFCTETEIIQVFLNLVKNAAQALARPQADGAENEKEPPRITLTTAPVIGGVRVEVADNGPGMTDDIRRRVFEPFFTTKEPGSGTGLGLSVSYFLITQNHNGRMQVESRPDIGSRFTLEFPLGTDQ